MSGYDVQVAALAEGRHPEHGSGASAMRSFLRALPAEIDRYGPFEMVFPSEPPRHTIELLNTLGVGVVVEPNRGPFVRQPGRALTKGNPASGVAQQIRAAADGGELVDGIRTAWCPCCREFVLPHDHTGRCNWCDGAVDWDRPRLEVVAAGAPQQPALTRRCRHCRKTTPTSIDENDCLWCGRALEPAPETEAREEEPVSVVAEHTVCKIPGCPKEAVSDRGRYAKLCEEHADEAKRAERENGGARGNGGAKGKLADSVKALLPAAKRLDRARARLGETPRNEQAKAALEEAIRRCQTHPTAENLAKLEEASKAMLKQAPTRERLQKEAQAATIEFKAKAAELLKTFEGDR